MNYIFAFDLSLASTGIAIFSEDGTCEELVTIETNSKDETALRLKKIADKIIKLKKEYTPNLVLIEKGFSRYNTSTQQVFRVHGLVNYLFAGTKQKYYPSSAIRKTVVGIGNVKKKFVRDFISEKYGYLNFKNFDESDAVACGLAWFIEEGIIEWTL